MIRTLSELVTHYTFLISIIGTLLLALTIRWTLLYVRHSWIGLVAGLLPILAFWAITYLVYIPSPDECQQSPLRCEWAGIGMFVLAILTLALAATFLVVAVPFGILYKRAIGVRSFTQKQFIARAPRIIGLFIIIFSATVTGVCLGCAMTNFLQSGLFIPWQPVSIPPLAPDEKLVRILTAYPESIFLETSHGNGLSLKTTQWLSDRRTMWEKWNSGEFGKDFKSLSEPCEVQFFPPPLLGAVQYVSTRRCMLTYQVSQTDYALMNNNVLWIWHRKVNPYKFPDYTLAVILGSSAGFLVGMGIVVRLERHFYGQQQITTPTEITTDNSQMESE